MKKGSAKWFALILTLSMAIIMLLAMELTAVAAWNGTEADTTWYTADTSASEFTISDAADLAGLSGLVNGGTDFYNKTIKLNADIELNGTSNWTDWDDDTAPANGWTPIGLYVDGENDKPFRGTFNGQNHTISGIYISTDNDYQGLFGYCSGAVIQNLIVSQSFILGGNQVGGIVGQTISGTMDNCSNSGAIRGTNCVGGLVGISAGAVSNSYNEGSVIGFGAIGGISGAVGGSGSLTGCYNTGAVGTSEAYYNGNEFAAFGIAGGVAGTSNGDITGCYNTGTVSTTGYYSGGVLGKGDAITIQGCYSTGELTVNDHAGGMIGSSAGCTIENCYTTGDINGSTRVGGIAGSASGNTVISQCYSTGDITAIQYIGGIAGEIKDSGTISACYSRGDIEASFQSAGGIAGVVAGSQTSNTLITNCYATGTVNGPNDIGGIAGYGTSSGKIQNCVALNASLSSDGTDAMAHRIYSGFITAESNLAWSAMPIMLNSVLYTPTDNTTGNDGEGKSATQLKTADPWTDAGFTSANGWIFTAGSLPTLPNTGGTQNATLPLYIEPFPAGAGTGSSTDQYQITDAVQLAAVAEKIKNDDTTFAAAYYKLMNDIDLIPYASWTPIGTSTNPFTGNFDGCGYEIQHLAVSGLDYDNQGLFGYLGSGALVKGVELTNASVSCTHSRNYIGGIAGYVKSGANVEECTLSGSVSGYGNVGGIAGKVEGTVRNCHAAGSVESTISSSDSFGGIAGSIGSTGLVEKCSSSASVSGEQSSTYNFGGIVGYLYEGTVQTCFATGDVSGIEDVGGIAGYVAGGGTLQNCYTTGNVTCTQDDAGGIVGYLSNNCTVKNCYATGDVMGIAIDGNAGNVAGDIYADETEPSNNATVTNCYYLGSAVPGSSEATAKTGAELATVEMAWIFNTTNGAEPNSGIWAQGTTPVFADSTHFAVYKLTLSGSAAPIVVYSNSDGSVALPETATGTNGKPFLGWFKEVSLSTPINSVPSLTIDDTIYGNFGVRMLSITDEEHTYNGSVINYAGTVTDNAAGIPGVSEVQLIYYIDQQYTKTTPSNSGSVLEGSAPKNAGSYYMEAVAEACELTTSATNRVSFIIKKANPVITVSTDHPSGQMYGQDVKATVTVAPPSGSPADGFPSVGEINLAATGATLKAALSASATPGVYTAIYTMPATYSSGQEATFTANIPTETANYKAYTATDQTAGVSLLDKKATVTTVTANDTSLIYGESAVLTAHVGSDDEAALAGTVQFTLDGVNVGNPATISNHTASITLDKNSLPFKSSAYTVGAQFTADSATETDYSNSSGSVNLTVSKKVLTIKAKDVIITTGAALPVPELAYSGFLSGDTKDLLTVTTPFTMEIRNTDNSVLTGSNTAGTYSIVITTGAATADNYEIVTADGILTIRGKSNGSSLGDGSATPETDDTHTAPNTVTVTIDAVLNQSGTIDFALTEKLITQAIKEAAEKTAAFGVDDIIFEVDIAGADTASGFTLRIPAGALGSLVDSFINQLKLSTPVGILTFDTKTLQQWNSQTTSDIDITVAAVDRLTLSKEAQAQIGNRPVYDFTVTSGNKTLSNLGGGAVTVSLPYTPEDGEDTDQIVIYYITPGGELVMVPNCVYDAKTGMVTFSVTHFSIYAVAYHKVSFSDVSGWYQDYVDFLAARGIINGTDGKFDPNDNITRAQLATILANLSGDDLTGYHTSSFTDVPTAAWYFAAVQWAYEKGVANGMDGKFDPNASITRQDIAVMISRYADKIANATLPETKSAVTFSDNKAIASYAGNAVTMMQKAGIISGNSNGSFAPMANATRAEAAKMIALLLQSMIG